MSIRPSIAGLCVLLAVCGAAKADGLLGNGQRIPESNIVRNHPALKELPKISPALWQYGKEALADFHCLIFDERLARPGPVSVAALSYGRRFPAGTVGPDLERLRIRPGEDILPTAFKRMFDYVMTKSNGNADAAAALVKIAERHDARCVQQFATAWKIDLQFKREGMFMFRDARDGTPFLSRQSAQDRREIGEALKATMGLIQQNERDAVAISQVYNKLYAALAELSAANRPKPSPPAPATTAAPVTVPAPATAPAAPAPAATVVEREARPVPAAIEYKPVEIEKATLSIRLELQNAAAFCIQMAASKRC